MKKLLKLLIAGGITVVIASSVAIGIAINKSKSTSDESTEAVVTNESISNDQISNEADTDEVDSKIANLSVSFKSLSGTELILAKQAVLGITVGKNEPESNQEAIFIPNNMEVEILDLSKTMGNLEWIKKQLEHPNIETSAISVKKLHKIHYKQKIVFSITLTGTSLFQNIRTGFLALEVSTKHVPAVVKKGKTTTLESWNFIFTLINEAGQSIKNVGTFATNMPKIRNSEVFKTALNKQAIINANFEILLWKSGSAKPDGTDFDIAIMLNKRTGKVFICVTGIDSIQSQRIKSIFAPTVYYN